MRAVILLCLSLAVDAVAAPADDLREFIRLEKELLDIPGVSVALIDNGVAQYMNFGVRRAGENDEVSSTDAFNVGSISKTVTAWAIMRLAEQGLVSLDAPVQEYLGRRWQLPDSEFDNELVTLRRILSHTAGLSRGNFQASPWGSPQVSLEESLNGNPSRSSAVRVVVEPGTEYRYSNGGFALLQIVIENVTGQSHSDFVRSEIFEPLGMEHAEYLPLDREPLAVSPHDYAGRPITDYRMIQLGPGGVRASAQDLVNFLLANMRPNPVLSETTVAAMHEAVASVGGDTRPTLGFERRGSLLSHGGHDRGWVAQIDFQPSSRSGLVILANSANGVHFVQPVRCEWSELFAIDDLAEYCQRLVVRQRITHWSLMAASGAALLLAIWIAWRGLLDLETGAAKVVFSAATVGLGLLCIASIAAIWTVLGTGLGVYLASGVKWGLPTIGYLPSATAYVATASTVLLGVLASASFLRASS